MWLDSHLSTVLFPTAGKASQPHPHEQMEVWFAHSSKVFRFSQHKCSLTWMVLHCDEPIGSWKYPRSKGYLIPAAGDWHVAWDPSRPELRYPALPAQQRGWSPARGWPGRIQIQNWKSGFYGMCITFPLSSGGKSCHLNHCTSRPSPLCCHKLPQPCPWHTQQEPR